MNRCHRFFLTFAILILVSGCSLFKPQNKGPIVVPPTAWRQHGANVAISSDQVNMVAWWKKFHDPELNRLIADALMHNNDVGIAAGNMMQAKASLQKVRYSWLPTFGVGAGDFGFRAHDFSISQPVPIVPATKVNNLDLFSGYVAGFVPQYTLNIMRQIEMGKVATLSVELQKAALDAVRLGIISQVTSSYFSLLGFKHQLALRKQLAHDVANLRKYAKIQVQNGAISPEDVAALDQSLALVRKKESELRYNIVKVENALSILTNKNPGSIVTHRTFTSISTKGVIPINLPSETLKVRPDVAIAAYQLQIKQAMVGVSASQLFPTFNLTGFLGTSSIDLMNFLHLGSGLGYGQAVAGMPLLNLGIYADIAQQKGARYSACYHFIKTVKNAFAEVDTALSAYSETANALSHQQRALQKAQDQYHIALIKYKQGTISYAETIIYKLNVDKMKAILNENKMSELMSMVKLYQALGGGYLHPNNANI